MVVVSRKLVYNKTLTISACTYHARLCLVQICNTLLLVFLSIGVTCIEEDCQSTNVYSFTRGMLTL